MHFLDILHTNAVVVWLVPEQAHFVTEATTVTLHTLEFQFFSSLIILAISGMDKIFHYKLYSRHDQSG